MTDNHSGQQTEIRAENIGVVGDHARIEGGIHFHREVIVYDGIRPVSAGALLDACQAQVASILYDARRKYDSQLYVNRAIERDLCAFFDMPLDGPGPNCFLIVAPAGSGKTNLLCDLARVRVSRQPVLLLMGGSTYLSGTTGLLGAVKEELETASSQVAFRSAGDSLHTLHRLAEEIGRDALLLLDGINEHDRPAAMRQALEDLLRRTRGRRIKLVVACRDYYWGLFKGSFWEGATVNDLPAEDDVDEEDTGAEEDDFSRFAADEHERALDLYLEHYAISGRPVGDAAEQCRHPLLLRFFCEAYRGQEVSEMEDIRLKELFDCYWRQKLVSIADRMIKQGDERLQDGLAEEVGGYLLNVAAYMLHNSVRVVLLTEMSRATQRMERYDDPRSVYGRIRDEFIILEEKERGKGQRKESRVAFVYEEFMEYVMARSLMRDWDQAGLDKAAILSEIETLTGKYKSFAQILGVMVYLALMLKEERDLALWSLLLDKGERWQRVVCDAFRKLPEEQLDAGVFDVLREMLTTSDENTQMLALDTLKVKRVGKAATVPVVSVVCELVTHPQESIRRRAVLVLGNTVETDLAMTALIQAVSDPRQSVRKNAITALIGLGDARAVDLFVSALKDSRDWVRAEMVEALGVLAAQIDDAALCTRAAGPLVAALKDSDPEVRSKAAEKLGELGVQLGDAALCAQVVESLIATLEDWYWAAREEAAQALGKLGDPRAVEPLIAVLQDSNPGVRQSAAWALGELGAQLDDAALRAQMVDSLSNALVDWMRIVRQAAAEALGKLGDARAIEPLNAALFGSDGWVRLRIVEALGKLGVRLDDAALCAKAVELLIAIFKDPSVDVRREAVRALGELGMPAKDPLIIAVKDRNKTVRGCAAAALGELGARLDDAALCAQIVEPLSTALRDKSSIVQREAAEALIRLGEAAVDPLIAALGDKDREVRSRAAEALGKLGAQLDDAALLAQAAGSLTVALQDHSKVVRANASEALRRIGTPEALAAVREYEGG